MQTIAISAGVRLTPLDLDDAADLFALTDANRAHLRIWLPWLDGIRRIEDTRAFIRTAARQASRNDGAQFAVRVDGAIAGVIGHHRDRLAQPPHLPRLLAGRGLPGPRARHRACRSLLAHAFDAARLNRVEIRCAAGNRRSCAIPRRLGFREEGMLREAEWLYDHFVDHVVYGMLASDWRRSGGARGAAVAD